MKREDVFEDVEKRREGLGISIKEGGFSAASAGFGNSFISPFAIALNATNFQIGFLSSFVGLVGPLSQWFSSHIMEKFSRKKIVIWSVVLQALVFIPIIVLALFFWKGIMVEYLPIFLIVFYSLYIGVGAVAGPSWFSWMGDLVPGKERGRYFGKRNRITGAVAIVSMLIGGFFLDYFRTQGLALIGFSILFSVAMITRLIAGFLFTKQYYVDMRLKRGYYFSLKDFVVNWKNTNFAKFVTFVSVFYLAVYIASPFFAVYMLRELEFSYVWYTAITLSQTGFSLIAFPLWGKFADKYGNRRVLWISSLFLPLVPILWMFSTSKIYLILVPALVGGVFWGGFTLSAFNFIYDSVTPEHRGLCSIYNNVFVGLGVFFGSIVGGVIAKFVSVGFLNIFLFLFLVSGILRLVAVFTFLPRVKEVRKYLRKPPVLMKDYHTFYGIGHNLQHYNSLMLNSSHLPRGDREFERFRRLFYSFDD